ncbi:MAG: DUF2934 domain-containing protein [Candidatus Methylumidiphilus sp.]
MSAVKKSIIVDSESPDEASKPLLSSVPAGAELGHLIAEAAYYKAEKRGFEPGHEDEDWLAAENEVLSLA